MSTPLPLSMIHRISGELRKDLQHFVIVVMAHVPLDPSKAHPAELPPATRALDMHQVAISKAGGREQAMGAAAAAFNLAESGDANAWAFRVHGTRNGKGAVGWLPVWTGANPEDAFGIPEPCTLMLGVSLGEAIRQAGMWNKAVQTGGRPEGTCAVACSRLTNADLQVARAILGIALPPSIGRKAG